MSFKNISIVTFGCKMNQAESQAMGEKFLELGFNVSYNKDLIEPEEGTVIINSCTVTSEAERKIKQYIRKVKRSYPGIKIIVVGCGAYTMPQAFTEAGADLVLGNHEKKHIQNYITEHGIRADIDYWKKEDDPILVPKESYEGRTRVFFPVQEGCLNSCTYCRIVFARGRKIKSIEKNEVIKIISGYIEKGFKEIVLTGINLSYYGYDNDENLEGLISLIEKKFCSKSVRIRLTSLYPDSVTDGIIDVLTTSSIFEHHIHYSLQHISEDILKKMGRRYTASELFRQAELLRSRDPYFCLTSDIIVGFPGETETDIYKLSEGIKNLDMLKVHVFRFSPRPQTLAASFSDQVLGNDKAERMRFIEKTAYQSREKYLQKFVGIVSDVLVEKDTVAGKTGFGYDQYYVPHHISISGRHENDFLRVRSISFDDKGVKSIVL